VSDTYMAPPPAEDLIEALAVCLREHVEERKRELAHAQEMLARAQQVLEGFNAAVKSGGSVAAALYDLRFLNAKSRAERKAKLPLPDLSMVEDYELVREYLRLLDILVHTKPIPLGVGASYDDLCG